MNQNRRGRVADWMSIAADVLAELPGTRLPGGRVTARVGVGLLRALAGVLRVHPTEDVAALLAELAANPPKTIQLAEVWAQAKVEIERRRAEESARS